MLKNPGIILIQRVILLNGILIVYYLQSSHFPWMFTWVLSLFTSNKLIFYFYFPSTNKYFCSVLYFVFSLHKLSFAVFKRSCCYPECFFLNSGCLIFLHKLPLNKKISWNLLNIKSYFSQCYVDFIHFAKYSFSFQFYCNFKQFCS